MASDGVVSKAEVLSPGSLGDTELKLLRFELNEALSQPFELQLELASLKPALDTAAAIGKPLGVKLTLPGGKLRHLHGHVASAALVGSLRGRLFRYDAVVRPAFWFLRHTRRSLVHSKDDDAVTIVRSLLQKAPLSPAVDVKTSEKCAGRPYCVQYQESDFDFVSRLLEQEGIYYFFEHDAGSHRMVLADAPAAHQPLIASASMQYRPGASKSATDADSVLEWLCRDSVGTARFALRDFDFERPTTRLDATAQAKTAKGPALEAHGFPEGYRADGADKGAAKGPPDKQAQRFADALAAQRDASARQIDGATDALSMACGRTFEIDALPNSQQNGKYLCTGTRIEFRQGLGDGRDDEGTSYACQFGALSAKVPFRPERATPWPRVPGPQTAMVIGQGEIDPDEYGRVKVRFHWGVPEQQASCWVRVSHPWAGKGFGMVALPRVGDEVVVDFIDGDPDRPLITGRVYNQTHMPPYALPARKTVSGIRTRSSEGGGEDNFNELRFDDKKGDEHLWLQAEKDFHRHVKNDASDVVGRDEQRKVGRDLKEEFVQDWQVTVGRHWSQKVGGDTQIDIAADTLVNIGAHLNASVASDVLAKVGGKTELDVGGDAAVNVGGNTALTTGSNLDVSAGQNVAVAAGTNLDVKAGANAAVEAGTKMDVKAGMKITGEAGMMITLKAGTMIAVDGGTQITLKAGPSTITLGPTGVTIDGPLVKINSGGGGGSAGSAAAAKKAKSAAKAQPKKPKEPAKPTEQKDPIKS